jgi:hypothetical protein
MINNLNKRSKRTTKNLILNAFGFEFNLKLKPINYSFYLLSNKSDCFYNGHVNDDLTSTVYINLCKNNKMVSFFLFFFSKKKKIFDSVIIIFIKKNHFNWILISR